MDALGDVPAGRPLVLFDLDGTLLDGRTIHHLARKHGLLDEARERWDGDDRGPTSVSSPVKEQVAELFEGVPERDLFLTASELSFHGEVPAVLADLRQKGCILGVATGSYHVAAERARRSLMLDIAEGVQLEVEDGVVTGRLEESGYDGACGEWICKQAVLEAHAARYDATPTVAVGDGLNDVCMLEAADVGVAVPQAAQAAREAADVVAPITDVPGLVAEHTDHAPGARLEL